MAAKSRGRRKPGKQKELRWPAEHLLRFSAQRFCSYDPYTLMTPTTPPSPSPRATPRWVSWLVAGGAFSALAVSAGAAWWFWVARPLPAPAAPFVFRDGFEGSAKTEDLFPADSSRWQGLEIESTTGLASNSVTLTTERVHSGTNALKCVAAPFDGRRASEADIEREGLRFVKGDHVWFSAWFWLEGGTESSSIFLWDLESTSLRNAPGRRLFLQNGEMVASDLGKWWTAKKFRAVGGAPKFPKNQWVEVKIHLRLSDGADGQMQVWQDGVKVLDETGKTLPRARTVYDRMQVGLTASSGRSQTQTLFVDDVVLSNRPL